VVFFDDAGRTGLLPLTYTRPACELRTGILTISEAWTKKGASIAGYITEPYLSNKYPKAAEGTYIHVNGRLFPDDVVCEAISRLGHNEALIQGETVLAWNGSLHTCAEPPSSCHSIKYEGAILIERCSDLFSRNDEFIPSQFEMLTAGRNSAPLHSSVTIIGDPSLVFAEPGARALACTKKKK
ncbi:MAG: hypothetical protein KDC12_16070, partial [Flavobacteriales bacterium]|nr:hypothetical protein [Flavobacteriales bacterium]